MAKPKWSSLVVVVCVTRILTLDRYYPRRQAINLREVVIGGLTAWMGGNTCRVEYIMSIMWSSRQHDTQKDDYTDVRLT